jgi:hypothetical protein
MGSLDNGLHINKDYNRKSIKHEGKRLLSVNSATDIETVISNSGVVSTGNFTMTGVVFAPTATPKNEALSLTERKADNSVNRELFTHDATPSGELEHDVTRCINAIQVSVSHRQTNDALGPMRTVTERKIFASGDWNIFNASGVAVGATLGTTDTDVTPSGVGTY